MKRLLFAVVAGALAFAAQAQVPSYGPSLNLEQARKAVAAAQVEARKQGWPVAIAVVDTHGFLIAYEKMDDTQTGSVQVSIDKAVSAAMFRRPTKAFQDGLAGGGAGWRLLGLRGANTLEGGVTVVIGGKIVGGIGVSGVNGDQDAQVAKAGADALK